MEAINLFFNKYVSIPETEFDFFADCLEEKIFSKKDIIIEKGKIENFLYFLDDGIVRLYYPDISNEKTFSFVFKENFFSAYDSFLLKIPCRYEIQCLVDSKVHRISYENLQKIYNGTKNGNEIGRKIAEQLFLNKLQRENDLLLKSATERYLSLFQEKPELIPQIPLKYIASYIGITPQALSRIRKKIF
ncbi:Crp/Fnr family transcriptional regulator [Chryseobacterium oncorhynchi]|uniref:CarD family transcriptional regulator n=1 Tax=Chryseobacterium oncorhynchi TaxID=741074 RepID=A0A316WID7_9FLAO|nr:Crp/Fnr family transcriptional regulator [Chryseobacterium oncorhynchi]PWN60056.1 CarD family transcriptional regulator [Chryseobacterium oncorhynchi]